MYKRQRDRRIACPSVCYKYYFFFFVRSSIFLPAHLARFTPVSYTHLISKLADHRIEKVEDACKIGDMMWVKVTDIDEKGRVNLSHKDAMKEIKAKEAAGERIK